MADRETPKHVHCPDCGGTGIVTERMRRTGRIYTRCNRCYAHIQMYIGGRRSIDASVGGEVADEVASVVRQVLEAAPALNISVSESSIGLLNLGEIDDVGTITANAQQLATTVDPKIAEAFAALMEAVLAADDIKEPRKGEVLEQIAKLSAEAKRPPEKRTERTFIDAVVSVLERTLQSTASVAQVWSTWGPLIRTFFGV